MVSLIHKITDLNVCEDIMKELKIGDIINYQIEKKLIAPKKLTEVLCSASSLKRG